MKKYFIASLAFLVLCEAAAAADLPIASSESGYRPILPYVWTGAYVGGNLGGTFSRTEFKSDATPSAAIPANAIVPIEQNGNDSVQGKHFTGGVQSGFNWQASRRLLIGVEADINWLGDHLSLDRNDRVPAIVAAPPAPIPVIAFTNSLDVRWLATVRGRVGATFDRVLVYVTGGAAFTSLNYSQVFSVNATNVAGFGVTQSSGSSTVTNFTAGWTAGAGLEWALWDPWTAKVEYLYAQFGGQNTSTLVCSGGLGCAQNLSGSTDPLRVHIARFGLNYRFGLPVIANF